MHDMQMLALFAAVVYLFILCDLLARSRLSTYLYVWVSVYALILMTNLEDYVRRRL